MNLSTLRELIVSLKRDLADKVHYGTSVSRDYDPILYSRLENIVAVSMRLLPDHGVFLSESWKNWNHRYTAKDADDLLNSILEFIGFEEKLSALVEDQKFFQSGEEKMKEAATFFKDGDYPSCMGSLNTALELLIKDKLGIPATIPRINTANIIEICVKYDVGPTKYLSEARKHVSSIDNKVKHEGYKATKIDCIDGIKAMEELASKLRRARLSLSEEVRNKIFGAL